MRYVNDKYKEYYDKVERDKIYKQNKVDLSKLLICSVFIAPLIIIIFIGVIVSISSSNSAQKNKDKFVEIGSNSLGCIKYRYNDDIIWKCEKYAGITQIEREECTSNGKTTYCTTYQDPVIKSP